MKQSQRRRNVWLLAIISVLFLMADTCFHSVNKKQATVYTFEDADGDGQMDRDEAPLPDTLVLGKFNIHGSQQRSGALTDQEGKAILSVEFTHFFEVIVVLPCGAQATTPTRLDATEEKQLRFGFSPQNPAPGAASVRFHLWEDKNGNGTREDGEETLGGFHFSADPLVTDGSLADVYFGILAMQTDSKGEATLALGNSCGNLVVPFLYQWKFTSISPEPANNEGGLWFPYQEGITDVSLGLQSIPTPTPSWPTWTPEEGR